MIMLDLLLYAYFYEANKSLITHSKTSYMKKNMGNADRIIRLLLAFLMASLSLTNVVTGTVGNILLAVAGIFLLTSIVGMCPLYSLLGFNTCPRNKPVQ